MSGSHPSSLAFYIMTYFNFLLFPHIGLIWQAHVQGVSSMLMNSSGKWHQSALYKGTTRKKRLKSISEWISKISCLLYFLIFFLKKNYSVYMGFTISWKENYRRISELKKKKKLSVLLAFTSMLSCKRTFKLQTFKGHEYRDHISHVNIPHNFLGEQWLFRWFKNTQV